MNSIEAMEAEIRLQVQSLKIQELPLSGKNCLFVGCGDSYVAGLIAQHVSGDRAICCSPTDLIHNPSLAVGRAVYFVSISGNTQANILAAKMARRRGFHITAITAKTTSRLARECNQTIELKYRTTGVTTAGTISFTSSMLACISLTKKLELPDLCKAYRLAQKRASRISDETSFRRSYFILGSGMLHPIAIYGALKFHEVFGAKAMAFQVEEFCHSPLFSIKKDDQIIVIGSDGRRLNNRLEMEGFSSVYVDFKGRGIELLIQSIFFIQLLVSKLAQKRHMTSCYFLKNKRLLRMSSDLIYG